MKKLEYKTKGTCSRQVNIAVEDGIIVDCEFIGGCAGNTKGVASLVIGMKTEDAINKLKGIKCGFKPTSCPDQLARALEALMES